MPYNSGEIYFVHEETDKKGSRSPFIKIGLVAEKDRRNSHQRLTEHQTGNPRRLYLNESQIVSTEAVNVVELRLHQIFAEFRVNGEWFEFPTDEQVEYAVSQARQLSDEMQEVVKIFRQADELKNVASNGKSKTPTDFDTALMFEALEAKMKLKLVDEAEADVRKLLTLALQRGVNIQAVAKPKVKEFKPKFDAKTFKQDNPELWEEYVVDITDFKPGSFILKTRATDAHLADEEFKSVMLAIGETIKSVTSDEQLEELNEPMLKLTHLKGAAQYDNDLATAKLKVSLGEFDEISDVCSWKRAVKTTRKLNEGQLAIDHPELVLKYITTPQPQTTIRPNRRRA